MRTLTLLIGLVLAVACSSKKDSPGGGGPTPKALPATGATGALDCDRVLSKDLRAKYFANATITNNPQPIAEAGECKIKMGEEEATVTVTCLDNMAAAMGMSIEGLKKNVGAKDLPGVGKGAVSVDMGTTGGLVTAWDDDSNCSITVVVPKPIDPVAFSKDLLASLPPK